MNTFLNFFLLNLWIQEKLIQIDKIYFLLLIFNISNKYCAYVKFAKYFSKSRAGILFQKQNYFCLFVVRWQCFHFSRNSANLSNCSSVAESWPLKLKWTLEDFFYIEKRKFQEQASELQDFLFLSIESKFHITFFETNFKNNLMSILCGHPAG